MKNNVHFVNTDGEEVVVTPEKSSNNFSYKLKNATMATLLTSVLLTSCWRDKDKDSAQTAKLKAQTEKSKELDKAKNKLAKEKEDVVKAEQEVTNAQEAYDESLSQ